MDSFRYARNGSFDFATVKVGDAVAIDTTSYRSFGEPTYRFMFGNISRVTQNQCEVEVLSEDDTPARVMTPKFYKFSRITGKLLSGEGITEWDKEHTSLGAALNARNTLEHAQRRRKIKREQRDIADMLISLTENKNWDASSLAKLDEIKERMKQWIE